MYLMLYFFNKNSISFFVKNPPLLRGILLFKATIYQPGGLFILSYPLSIFYQRG